MFDEDEAIARVVLEANRAWCISIGDTSQPSWDCAPEWQKQSALYGIAFHRDNPKAGPDAGHNSWLKEKLESGWEYGPTKNPDLKQHPCLVPFEELPAPQQAKDRLIKAICEALITR